MEALYLSSSFHLPASNSLILILLPSCNYSFVGQLSGSVLLLILLQRKRERMPYFEVKANQEEREKSEDQSKGIQIFYRTYGHGRTKVLLIIGFAGTHESWSPQIKGLTSIQNLSDYDDDSIRDHEEEDEGIEVCCFDNRGMGRSSIPANKSQYTTTIMARDALSLMDHLGWKKAHVFGHSMGGMIAFRLAAIAPERVSSLALLNVSGGGYQCFPRVNRHVISLGFKFRAKTPEERAIIDLEVHYTKEYLDESVGSSTRRKTLYYGLSSTGMQSKHGFEGQINACWTHKMTCQEIDIIRSSGFPIAIIHGRDDVVAQLYNARRLAERLHPAAKMVELHGAHLVSHERPHEVNMALIDLTNASKSNVNMKEWSKLPERESESPMSVSNIGDNKAVVLVTLYSLLVKIQLSFLFFMGFFLMFFGHMRNITRILKPVRVLSVES